MKDFDERKQEIEENSPYSMPDDPQSSGWNTAQIKERFYAALFLLNEYLEELKVDTTNLLNTYKNEIAEGSVIVDRAKKDKNGNDIFNTYATKTALNNLSNLEQQDKAQLLISINDLKTKLLNGTYEVKKALQDSDGNAINTTYVKINNLSTLIEQTIASTYAKKSEIQNGSIISKKSQCDEDGNVIKTTYVKNSNAYSKQEIDNKINTEKGRIDTINNKIPNEASSSNKLADQNFVNSSINSVTAYYITKNAAGDPFATKAELSSATTFYSGGEIRVPTRNDYAFVLADETKEDASTRYIYQNGWQFQFIVNKTTLTAQQLAAINSGITAEKVSQIDTNKNDIEDIVERVSAIEDDYAKSADIPDTTELEQRVSDIENDYAKSSDIIPNPTLDGTESDLTSLQIGNTKFKVHGGSSGGSIGYEILDEEEV